MENLRQLVEVVNRNKVKRINLLDLKEERAGKVNELYRLLASGDVTTDEEAFERLFPDGRSRTSLSNAKNKLRQKLLNTLFFIDVKKNEYSDRQRAYYVLQKDLSAAQLLMVRHARSAAAREFKAVLKRAIQFEFTDLLLIAARGLRLYYGYRRGWEKDFHEMDALCEQYDLVDRYERLAEGHYTRLIVHYQSGTLEREALHALAGRYFAELDGQRETIETYGFRFYLLLIELFRSTLYNDYRNCPEICAAAIAFFEAKPYKALTPIQTCLSHLLIAHLQAGDYTQGKEVGLRSLQLVESGTFNWFRDLSYLFMLAMHAGAYQEAYGYYREATGHRQFAQLSHSVREIWELYRAYLHYLETRGLIEGAADDRRFRLKRFLNGMPFAEKDKRGLNVALLVVQLMFLIDRPGKDEDEVLNRIRAVRKYLERHDLQREDTRRSYLFLQLLSLIAGRSTYRTSTADREAQLLRELSETSQVTANPSHRMEIIPYERLWKIITRAPKARQTR